MHESHHLPDSTKSAHPCFQASWAVVSSHPDHCSFGNYWTAIVQVTMETWLYTKYTNWRSVSTSIPQAAHEDYTRHPKYSHGSNHTHSLTSI